MANQPNRTQNPPVVSMSSREIAELCGKRHDNVMADCRKMLVELYGEAGLLNFQDTHTNPQNSQTYPVFILPKRETLILVSGYSVKMRARIIDRLTELEQTILVPPISIPTRSRLLLTLEEGRVVESRPVPPDAVPVSAQLLMDLCATVNTLDVIAGQAMALVGELRTVTGLTLHGKARDRGVGHG
ncbi:hypothetical protein MishRS11D_12580 [Methylomagnum ishizawai]|nr:hypothetical protein MishRS11D_12580 [Methylomagnum ishizawai]